MNDTISKSLMSLWKAVPAPPPAPDPVRLSRSRGQGRKTGGVGRFPGHR